MSDNSFQQGNRRRRRRPRTDNRPDAPRSSAPRSIAAQQTGFQKFLSAISFGILGKPSTLPSVTPRSGTAPAKSSRPPRESRENREPREPKPRREAPPPPNPGDISTERLYVGNLSYDASESDLFELFNGVGGVRNAEVVVNNRTQRSKGFAFVTMSSVEEARRAVSELHGKEFMGRPLQLSGAKPIGSDDRGNDSDSDSEQVAA
jgi:RNA recognition motif-containing protein